jgi:hypothetical protein
MAFFERPDNAPWTALYDLYWQQMLPIGIGLWALIVLLLTSTRLFTHTAEGEYQRTRLERRAAFGLLMLIAWWPIGAFTLHLASALTMTIAPTGDQMVGTITEFMSNVAGGLLVGIIVYFSAGVVALLLLIVFLARYVAIFTLMPLMPILIPLWIVDEGPMKPLSKLAETIGGTFVPFVFMTVPTAAILLVGYTIQDSLRVWLSSIPAIGWGASGGPATPAYAVILFVFWVMALVAPVVVLLGTRGMMPFVYLGAGLISGAALGRGAGQAWRNRPRWSSNRPSWGRGSGSPSTTSPGRPSGLPHGGRSIEARSLARTRGDPASGTGPGHTYGPGGSPRPALPPGPVDGPSVGSTPSGGLSATHPVRARPQNWRELSDQLPDDRRYEFGYSREGDFQAVDPGPPNASKHDIASGKFRRMTNSRVFEGKPDMYLRDNRGEYYDVTSLRKQVQNDERFDQESRDVVTAARNYDPSTSGSQEGSNRGASR